MNIDQYNKIEYINSINKSSSVEKIHSENFYEYGEKNLSGTSLVSNRNQKDYFYKSFKRWLEHRNDVISGTGYLYQDNILMRSVSPILYENPILSSFLFRLDSILTFCVDHVKTIKRSYMFTVPKDYNFFN